MIGLVIGVDAGGSRTRVAVADANGETIATSEREGGAVKPGEIERSASIIAAAVRDALITLDPTLGAPRALCAGVAGVGRESERRALSEALLNESLADDVLVMTDAEIAMADAFGDEAGIVLIAGTGSNSTRETIEMSQAARKVGADGLLLVTPYYNRPGQDHLYRHFKAVVQAVPLPTVLYNVPSRTGCDLLPETLARLCELPEIVAVKEATGSTLRASQILAKTGDRLAVLSGDDATAFPLFALGGRGVISVVSNVAPREFSAMWDAAAAGDWNKARELHFKLLPLSEGLFVEANPVPVKAALSMMGRMADELRPPLYPLAEQHREKIRGMLRDLRLI